MLPKEAEVGVPEALSDLILALQAAVLAAEVADLVHVMILAVLALVDRMPLLEEVMLAPNCRKHLNFLLSINFRPMNKLLYPKCTTLNLI